jgi:hypothetical protein
VDKYKTLCLKQILYLFAEKIFLDVLSYMMNKLVLLESFQIQMVYAEKDNQALPQVSYSLGGKLPVDLFPKCPRPYVLIQMPVFGTGTRNKFALRFRGVADVFLIKRTSRLQCFNWGATMCVRF